jgi:hypothetical protein
MIEGVGGGEGWRYSVDRWCLVFDYLFFSFLSVPSFWNVNIIVGYVRLDCVCQSLLDVIMCVCVPLLCLFVSSGLPFDEAPEFPFNVKRFIYV